MKTCPRCNSSIEEFCRFCPMCGASLIIIGGTLPGAEEPAAAPEIPAESIPPPISPPPTASALPGPSLLQPALVSGLVMGGLSALPVLNVCCCLWMLGGGALASYLYLHQLPPESAMTSTEGARVGLVAGFFGFATGFTLIAFIQGVMLAGRGRFVSRFREHLQEMIARQSNVPPETRQFLDWLTTPGGTAFFLVFMITVFFLAFLVLGTLGGMLGANLLTKRARPTNT